LHIDLHDSGLVSFRFCVHADPHTPSQGRDGSATAGAVGRGRGDDATPGERSAHEPAPFVKPLYISKVNTVAQISLIAGCITSAWWGWPPEEVLLGLGGTTGVLTLASGAAYMRQHRKGATLK